jgi:patatin-related protein
MTDAPKEELKLALVMNGGVSLAVWMGGVTQEIHQLTLASADQAGAAPDQPSACAGTRDFYRALLSLTHSSASVDVISGTSAGGVNGAALAVALIHGGDFSLLRGVWLSTGSLQTLLRPPLGPNPGSLLQGDGYFLPQLEDALQRLTTAGTPPRPAAQVPVDLRLTTTLLTGHQGRHQDDLGTPLSDVDYRAQFHFRHLDDAGSFVKQPGWLQALARAARSTASFPFAFEPSRIDAAMADAYLRTPHGGKVPAGDRFVIDGGILDNKPFQGALEAIFGMPRHGPTRRILAYVNPDPGDGPEGRTGQPMPPLSTVLGEALFAIPQSQTVSDHLREITLHNDKVRKQRDSLLQVASALPAAQLDTMARDLFDVYRRRRLSNTFALLIEPQLTQAVATLGRRRLTQLKETFCASGDFDGWLPDAWTDDVPAATGHTSPWAWGLFPVEFATSVLLNVLKLAESLSGLPDPAHPGSLHDRQQLMARLQSLWPDVNAVTASVRGRRNGELATWLTYRTALADAWQRDQQAAGLSQLSDTLITGLSFLASDQRQAWCREQVDQVRGLLLQLIPLALKAAALAQQSSHAEARDLRQAQGLTKLCELLDAPLASGGTNVVFRLLQLEVISYAFDDHETMDQDTLIELVQVSGNLRSPLVQADVQVGQARPGAQGASKLRGLELAHFGAFYKTSWRANDWTHGRLDGADRLVHTLLSPERLRRLYPGQADEVATRIRALAFQRTEGDDDKTLSAMWTSRGSEAAIRTELAFLDQAGLPVPDTLPHCAAAVLRRMHLRILREELPHLVDAIASEEALAGQGASARLIRDMAQRSGGHVNAEDAVTALTRGLISDESLLEQAGTDLFTQTVAHVTASLQNTVASASAQLGPVSLFFAALKVPIQGFNLVVQGLTRTSRTAAALHAGMLAVGLMTVLWSGPLMTLAAGLATAGHAPPSLPESMVTMGWLLLVWGTLFTVLRAPRASTVLLLTAGLGVAMALGNWWALIGGAIALAALFCLPSLPTLQWLLGLGMIFVFASWSSGHPIWSRPDWRDLQAVEGHALALIGVLVVASWQASSLGPLSERRARVVLQVAWAHIQAWRHSVREAWRRWRGPGR